MRQHYNGVIKSITDNVQDNTDDPFIQITPDSGKDLYLLACKISWLLYQVNSWSTISLKLDSTILETMQISITSSSNLNSTHGAYEFLSKGNKIANGELLTLQHNGNGISTGLISGINGTMLLLEVDEGESP